MKKLEKEYLIEWASSLSDSELEKAYYDSVINSLGSECEKMYELGYDFVDIEERRKYERYLTEKSDILEQICIDRGISLFS